MRDVDTELLEGDGPLMLYCLKRGCANYKKKVVREREIDGETWYLLSCGHWLRLEV